MTSNPRIDVTQEDIDKATANHSNRCAVATAVKRCIPDASMITVDVQGIRYSRDDTDLRYVFLTPVKVQQYIVDFDAGLPIQPFSFWLRRTAYTGARRHGARQDKIRYTTIIRPHGGNASGSDGKVLNKVKAQPPHTRTSYRRYGMRGMRINQTV